MYAINHPKTEHAKKGKALSLLLPTPHSSLLTKQKPHDS